MGLKHWSRFLGKKQPPDNKSPRLVPQHPFTYSPEHMTETTVARAEYCFDGPDPSNSQRHTGTLECLTEADGSDHHFGSQDHVSVLRTKSSGHNHVSAARANNVPEVSPLSTRFGNSPIRPVSRDTDEEREQSRSEPEPSRDITNPHHDSQDANFASAAHQRLGHLEETSGTHGERRILPRGDNLRPNHTGEYIDRPPKPPPKDKQHQHREASNSSQFPHHYDGVPRPVQSEIKLPYGRQSGLKSYGHTYPQNGHTYPQNGQSSEATDYREPPDFLTDHQGHGPALTLRHPDQHANLTKNQPVPGPGGRPVRVSAMPQRQLQSSNRHHQQSLPFGGPNYGHRDVGGHPNVVSTQGTVALNGTYQHGPGATAQNPPPVPIRKPIPQPPPGTAGNAYTSTAKGEAPNYYPPSGQNDGFNLCNPNKNSLPPQAGSSYISQARPPPTQAQTWAPTATRDPGHSQIFPKQTNIPQPDFLVPGREPENALGIYTQARQPTGSRPPERTIIGPFARRNTDPNILHMKASHLVRHFEDQQPGSSLGISSYYKAAEERANQPPKHTVPDIYKLPAQDYASSDQRSFEDWVNESIRIPKTAPRKTPEPQKHFPRTPNPPPIPGVTKKDGAQIEGNGAQVHGPRLPFGQIADSLGKAQQFTNSCRQEASYVHPAQFYGQANAALSTTTGQTLQTSKVVNGYIPVKREHLPEPKPVPKPSGNSNYVTSMSKSKSPACIQPPSIPPGNPRRLEPAGYRGHLPVHNDTVTRKAQPTPLNETPKYEQQGSSKAFLHAPNGFTNANQSYPSTQGGHRKPIRRKPVPPKRRRFEDFLEYDNTVENQGQTMILPGYQYSSSMDDSRNPMTAHPESRRGQHRQRSMTWSVPMPTMPTMPQMPQRLSRNTQNRPYADRQDVSKTGRSKTFPIPSKRTWTGSTKKNVRSTDEKKDKGRKSTGFLRTVQSGLERGNTKGETMGKFRAWTTPRGK
ncbi:hypothetical protein V8F20_010524 [Naviculisporaceae sp. PSN 640]